MQAPAQAETLLDPAITVCVCTHNRPDYLRMCLDGLGRQTTGPAGFELIVVDSASAPAIQGAIVAMVAGLAAARLIRLDQPGVSLARNAAMAAASGEYIAYLDDDAIPAPDWVASIRRAIRDRPHRPALIGGRILPRWETALPGWWPPSLRGVLSIIELVGEGEYRTASLPPGLEPYAANMVVDLAALRAAGGFGQALGRSGDVLLSDEEIQLAWSLQNAGLSVRYDSRIVVEHQIQAGRLRPDWLLSRLFWQGVSTVVTRRMLGDRRAVRRELPRRLLVALLLAPTRLIPRRSTRLIAARWRFAYALGFVRAALAPAR